MNHHFFRLLCPRHFSSRASGSARFSFAGKKWEVSTGQLAPHADSSVLVNFGDTAVLAAVFAGYQASYRNENKQTIVTDYSEKQHISMDLTQNYFMRSSRPFEKLALISRSIDRTVRPLVPLLPTTLNLTCVLLASDGVHDPEIAAINAAAATLALTGTPGIQTSAAVRMGQIGGAWIVNPDRDEFSDSEANYIVSCTKRGISMIQGHSSEVSLTSFNEMLELAFMHTYEFITRIETLKSSLSNLNPFTPLEDERYIKVYSCLKEGFYEEIKDILASPVSKLERGRKSAKLNNRMMITLQENFPNEEIDGTEPARTDLYKEALRENVRDRNVRPGGRETHQLRDLYGRLGPLKATHGSALFQRGESQILSSLSLRQPSFSFDLTTGSEVIDNRSVDNFSLHYSNPDYAVRDKAGIRRDLGHSRLAEGALLHLIPTDFPLSINLFCDVQSSGGSTSMASICAASLALLDGGVPLKKSAAGVATGLLVSKDGPSTILSDVQGIEDALGNMDLKVGGTREGITTCQLDIKETDGIPLDTMRACLDRSCQDRLMILNFMEGLISEPRLTLKNKAPVSSTINLNSNTATLYNPGWFNKLRRLQQDLNVSFHILDPGHIYLFAKSSADYENALNTFHRLLAPEQEPELEFGALYRVKVVEVRSYGIMVQLFPNQTELSLIHQSQLYPSQLLTNLQRIKVDDVITVKYFGRDPLSGRLRLSKKAAMISYEPEPVLLSSNRN